MSENHPSVLVCGAAGRVGRTGRYLVKMLREKNIPVRAMVRTMDERADALAETGAEIVCGDLFDMSFVRKCLAGVKRAYFACSVTEQLTTATTLFAIAAKDANLDCVVAMSQFTVMETTPSPATFQHYLSDQIWSWSGVPHIILRPSPFMEQLSMIAGKGVAARNELRMPFGEGRQAPIAGFDIARVLAELLQRPEAHLNKEIYITGPQSMNMTEMASALSDTLHRHIDYVDIPVEVYREQLQRAGMSEHLNRHLCSFAVKMREGLFDRTTDTVEVLTGRAPMALTQFVEQESERFGGINDPAK